MAQTTTLHQNPFYLLGVTTRDSQRRIIEKKFLNRDHNTCEDARSELLNPKTRLRAELAWLPAVSPRKIAQLAALLLQDRSSIWTKSGLPSLAHTNLMAAALELVDANDNPEDIAKLMEKMAFLIEDLSAEEIIGDINEDRAISGFLDIRAEEIIAELEERKRYFRKTTKEVLTTLPPLSLTKTVTLVVDNATTGGKTPAPELINELVAIYKVEVQDFLQRKSENIYKLISAVREATRLDENAINSLISKLELVAWNWHRMVQPIQINAKTRGIDHEPSYKLAGSLHNLAFDLFKGHDLLTQSQRLTNLTQRLFVELPEIVQRVAQDAEMFQEIFYSCKQQAKAYWVKKITYRVEIGFFKHSLSISPDGLPGKINTIRWKLSPAFAGTA